MNATAFAPGSIGNVGPGFDVLGLAVEGIGDRVTVELTDGFFFGHVAEGVGGGAEGLKPEEAGDGLGAKGDGAQGGELGFGVELCPCFYGFDEAGGHDADEFDLGGEVAGGEFVEGAG